MFWIRLILRIVTWWVNWICTFYVLVFVSSSDTNLSHSIAGKRFFDPVKRDRGTQNTEQKRRPPYFRRSSRLTQIEYGFLCLHDLFGIILSPCRTTLSPVLSHSRPSPRPPTPRLSITTSSGGFPMHSSAKSAAAISRFVILAERPGNLDVNEILFFWMMEMLRRHPAFYLITDPAPSGRERTSLKKYPRCREKGSDLHSYYLFFLPSAISELN